MAVVNEDTWSQLVDVLNHDQLVNFFDALGINRNDVDKEKRGANTRNENSQAKAVLRFWLQRNGQAATHKAILEALSKCQFTRTVEKLQKLPDTVWKNTVFDKKVVSTSDTDIDITVLVNALKTDELKEFFLKLGISEIDIEKAEERANTNDPNLRAHEVCFSWRQQKGAAADRKAVLQALKSCQYFHVLDKFKDIWPEEYALVEAEAAAKVAAAPPPPTEEPQQQVQ